MNKNTTCWKFSLAAACLALLFGLTACKKDGNGSSCDAATLQGCEAGAVCQLVGPGQASCLTVCDPAAADSCGSGKTCLRYADGTYGCTATCGGTGDCPEGWACAPLAGTESVCRPSCDLAVDTCPEDEVCQPLPDGTAVCTAQCDPVLELGCSGTMACELRTDGLYACYDPVFLRGMVFDSTTEEPIPQAHVIAADKTGASASNVAITDAAGLYELQVPVEREPDGALHEGILTLRVSAADYLPYPYGIRPAIPVDAAQAQQVEGRWVLENASTEVALIPLPADQQGQGSIAGSIIVTSEGAVPGGVLVVVEGTAGDAPLGFSDRAGAYTVFNVPAGTWEVRGYRAFLQLDPVSVTLAAGEDKIGVNLTENAKPYGTVTGSVNIVNAPGGSMTSIVLVPESTFNDTFVKGEVPPGLRDPAPPEDPSVSGPFSIEGVPDGSYVVLAAFENDILVRDPDPNIAGTTIQHVIVPDGASYTIAMPSSFKVTEALVIVSPGAEVPEAVTGNPTFIWMDDSSEDSYGIVVYNAFGDEVWRDDALPRVTGSVTVEVPYPGPPDAEALVPGMYYQFRATSYRTVGPISQTEDLLGVFYIPSA